MIFGLFWIKKISIVNIIKDYFSIYFGGYIDSKKTERKLSIGYIFFLGIVPYFVGCFGTLSFWDCLKKIDLSVLASFDGMLLSIMAILLGFEILNKKTEEKRENDAIKETNSLLFIGVILVLIDSILLSIFSINISEEIDEVLMSFYYAIKCKIIILFIASLHSIYYLNKTKRNTQ